MRIQLITFGYDRLFRTPTYMIKLNESSRISPIVIIITIIVVNTAITEDTVGMES